MSNNCLPVERSGHSAAVANDYLYIWGGQRAGRYLNDMFVFNLSTCKYTTVIAKMPLCLTENCRPQQSSMGIRYSQ